MHVRLPGGWLRRRLGGLLAGPSGSPVELPVLGTVLYALGMAGLASGEAGADADADAVRMIALAERLRAPREFQPTMSADRARQAVSAAGRTAGAAYADAVSEYAALERNELREAARAVMAVAATSGRG